MSEAVLHYEGVGMSAALEFGKVLGRIALPPGKGSTADLWEAFATIASSDLGAARAIEPHLDALAILKQAQFDSEGFAPDGSTWGVFAAEGADDPLCASERGGSWSLTGAKAWCSLADRLDCALVTAHLADGRRALFAVHLQSAGVSASPEAWHARGLAEIPSGPVRFSEAPAVPVGEPGWYLTREGFAWGGIGVAACWYGGAVGLGRALFERAEESPEPLLAAHLGAVDEQLQSARRALAEAARLIDAETSAIDGPVLAKRVRATVFRACESVHQHVAHALGPAPLALDADHAKRVADLELYIRQHHAERDDASLGAALAKSGVAPW
jgi:alkylation response protein AidB-like acyl-CoA dehydrogenase